MKKIATQAARKFGVAKGGGELPRGSSLAPGAYLAGGCSGPPGGGTQKEGHLLKADALLFGDPYETRTRVTAVKGRCLNHLTNGPYMGKPA